jgi:hypothetical protein
MERGRIREADEPLGSGVTRTEIEGRDEPGQAIATPSHEDGFHLRVVEGILELPKSSVIGSGEKAVPAAPQSIRGPDLER